MALTESRISHDLDLKVPTKRYPIVHTHKGVGYELFRVNRENIRDLRLRALPFEKEFGYEDTFLIHDKVKHYVREGGEVVFAKTLDRSPRDIGVTTQEIRRTGQLVVLSVGIRVVLPEYQNRGISTHMAREGIMRLRPDAATGQIRTWRIPCMYEDTGFIKGIPPFDEPLTPEIQQSLGDVLDKSMLTTTDLRTGLCLGVFPPVPPDRFIPPSTNERGMWFYNRIREIGADPVKGDAIRYFALVNQEAVETAIANGYIAPEVADRGLRAVANRWLLRRIASILRVPI